MVTVTTVALAMRTVLTTTAEAAGKATGFVKRKVKFTGATFTQTLVFGWLANAEATLEELCQTAAICGVDITPQGLDQRFTAEAAACLKQVLTAAVERVVMADPVTIPVLQRFNGVYLDDSSTIVLPDELADVWSGCGSQAGQGRAALKLHVRWDWLQGGLTGPFLSDGRQNDRRSVLQDQPLPPGSLRLADLGYWSLDELRDLDQADVFWLTRPQAQTAIFTADGSRWDLAALLQAQQASEVELAVELGVHRRLPARLLARRVPADLAQARRRRVRAEARRRGRMPTQASLVLADWLVYVTNAPAEKLTWDEVLVVARVRWQIELLFKLWKSHNSVDKSRSAQPWRRLCEIYAKLIGVVIQHWIFLVGCWPYANRSLTKAAQTVRKHAWHLASVFDHVSRLSEALAVVQRCLATGCRINKSKKTPRTYQLLLALHDDSLA
jgi:hypothetical protein